MKSHSVSQFVQSRSARIFADCWRPVASTLVLCAALLAPAPARADVQTAGKLVVSLDARDDTAGKEMWKNKGTLGDFKKIGAPKVTEVKGQKAVTFDGKADAYRSDKPTSGTVAGAHARSIELWAYNPNVDSQEECMIAWGRRGEDAHNMAFNYGTGDFGAVTHYGPENDMGWGDQQPAAGRWHHLVYTYNGKTTKIYSDGEEWGSGDHALETAAGDPISIGCENGPEGAPEFTSEFDPFWQTGFSGSIALIRVHDGALTAAQIHNNYNEDAKRFGLPPAPAGEATDGKSTSTQARRSGGM